MRYVPTPAKKCTNHAKKSGRDWTTLAYALSLSSNRGLSLRFSQKEIESYHTGTLRATLEESPIKPMLERIAVRVAESNAEASMALTLGCERKKPRTSELLSGKGRRLQAVQVGTQGEGPQRLLAWELHARDWEAEVARLD